MQELRGYRLRITPSVFAVLAAALMCVVGSQSCSDDDDRAHEPQARGGDNYPAWSPDGQTIAYLSENYPDTVTYPQDGMRTIDLLTRDVKEVWRIPVGLAVWDLTWSPDGRWLLFSSDVGVFKIRSTGDSLQQLTRGEFHRSPNWSKVTGRIYYAVRGLYSIRPDGSDSIQHLPPDSALTTLRCFRDYDSLLVCRDRSLGECLMIAAPASGWLGGLIRCRVDAVDHLRLDSRNEQVLFLGQPTLDGEYAIYRLSRGSGAISRIVDGRGFDLSPDDSTIVVADISPPRGLRLMNMYTKESWPLTRLNHLADDHSAISGAKSKLL